MTTPKCSTCSMPLVVANGREICARPACPGHQNLEAGSPAGLARMHTPTGAEPGHGAPVGDASTRKAAA